MVNEPSTGGQGCAHRSMTAPPVPTHRSMVVAEAPQEATVAPVQDALCALRLAVWTLERATARDGVDTDRVIDTLVRRAEELRQLLHAGDGSLAAAP
jgi:hypothetical protein